MRLLVKEYKIECGSYLQKITKQLNMIPLIIHKSQVTYLVVLLSIGFTHPKLVDKVVKKLEGKNWKENMSAT